MKIQLFLITFFFWCIALHSQSPEKNDFSNHFKRAIAAADNSDFNKAIAIYSQILEKSPNNVDALTQLGFCFMTTNNKLDSALFLFNKALTIIPQEETFSPFGIYLQRAIARTHNLNYEPEKALAILSILKDSVADIQQNDEINQEIGQTRNAIVLLKNPGPLKITNLGELINSAYDDHSPLVSLVDNRIFFTSRRPAGHDRELSSGQFTEKVFSAEYDGKNWQKPDLISQFFSHDEHKAALSLSPDGSQMFLFKNDRNGKSLYVSQYRNGQWQETEKLPAPINSQWDETHACLSSDQSTMYFTSTRPGGYGGLDIYMVKKDEYGNWGEIVNLGPNINTEKDEETPMLHPDGKTLYFASEGHSSMGGFDIFFSQKQDDGYWVKAVNMGYPINSPDDDFFFVPTLNKSQAYFASYRFSKNFGRSDLYRVEFDSTYSGSLAVIEGTIKNTSNLPTEQIRILVSRQSDNHQVGDFRPNTTTGKYLLFLESGQNYIIREATPENVEEGQVIYIPDQMTHNESKKVVMMQEIQMLSPLIPLQSENLTNSPNTAPINTPENEEFHSNKSTYTVQILALKKSTKPKNWFFRGLDLKSISTLKGRDGYMRFIIGQFENMEDAKEYLSKIQHNNRFNDAWIRAVEPLMKISDNNKFLFANKASSQ